VELLAAPAKVHLDTLTMAGIQRFLHDATPHGTILDMCVYMYNII
jgi:hypothetical protein